MKIKPYMYLLLFIVLMNAVLLAYALEEISDVNNLSEVTDLSDARDYTLIGLVVISVIIIFAASVYIYKLSFS
jgi:hypothetical protein